MVVQRSPKWTTERSLAYMDKILGLNKQNWDIIGHFFPLQDCSSRPTSHPPVSTSTMPSDLKPNKKMCS